MGWLLLVALIVFVPLVIVVAILQSVRPPSISILTPREASEFLARAAWALDIVPPKTGEFASGTFDGVTVGVRAIDEDEAGPIVELTIDVDVGSLRIKREGSASKTLTGDVKTGDRSFDKVFRIEGDPADAISRLGSDARAEILSLLSHRVQVSGGRLQVRAKLDEIRDVTRRAVLAARQLMRHGRTTPLALLDVVLNDTKPEVRLAAASCLETRFSDSPETSQARTAIAALKNADAGQLTIAPAAGGEVSIAKTKGAVTLTKK